MENQPQSTLRSVSIKYGSMLGLISIIYFVLLDFAGQAQNQSYQFLGFLFTIAIFYFAYKEFKEQGDGYMSYSQGLGIGTLVALVSSVISGVFSWIYMSFINTSYLENMKQLQIAKLEEQGLSDAQIEQSMGFVDMFMNPTAILIMGIFMTVFFGFIIALIMSAIFKKSKPELI